VVAALPLPRPVLPVMQKTHAENGRRKRLLKRLGCHLTFNALPLKPLRRHPPVHARERRGMRLTRRKRLQRAAHQLCRAEDEAPISLTGGARPPKRIRGAFFGARLRLGRQTGHYAFVYVAC
jgi:hypothetical protein